MTTRAASLDTWHLLSEVREFSLGFWKLGGIVNCPKCKSDNVNVQVVNETDTRVVEKRHGIIWWVCIGWWWKPIKWVLQLVLFGVFAVLYWIFKSPRYKTVTRHQKESMTVCQDCGHTWEVHRGR